MFALIRFSETFYFVVPKYFFIPLIRHPDLSPPVYEPTQNPLWSYISQGSGSWKAN